MHEPTIIQRALLTVFDKTGIIPLAERLHLKGVELISTGNTAELLKSHGLPVTTVGDYTGFPEIMHGRVKTLHPKIHGGILGRRDVDADIMIAHDIPDIDLVVVNLYPFKEVTRNPNVTLVDAIENIDIGGPTLLRGASKNYQWCTVLVDPSDYDHFLQEFEENHGSTTEKSRFHYAAKAFAHTAGYDAAIANFLNKKIAGHKTEFGESLSLHYQLKERLRYGENPHQKGAFYQESTPAQDSITCATQLQGKDLSFNNIADGDTALECVKRLEGAGCVIVKHANPCGVAHDASLQEAYDKAFACDPTSAFGGIIAFNQSIDETLVHHIFKQQFVEVLIAPHFTDKAIEAAKLKPNCRLLQYHAIEGRAIVPTTHTDIKSVNGGILIQTWEDGETHDHLEVVTRHQPSQSQMQDLIFAWHVVKFVKSNGIVYAKNGRTLGIGAGQMSRIFSTEIAALKAKQQHLSLQDAVMASDAFFPFKDNLEKAYQYGIRAIIQPGGSIKDEEVIACANDLGIAMVLTNVRHFRH
jgi:phosphoribosylaminoimidazolecarboxamide formyltransferase / IMP cyclohydrolase